MYAHVMKASVISRFVYDATRHMFAIFVMDTNSDSTFHRQT
jgi:hypothetical protein